MNLQNVLLQHVGVLEGFVTELAGGGLELIVSQAPVPRHVAPQQLNNFATNLQNKEILSMLKITNMT